MLEIIAIVILCNANKKNAVSRGRKPGAFIALTIVFWLGFEFVGMLIGQAAKLDIGAYAVAIVFAIIGGAVSYFITKNCKPGTYVDPKAASGIQMPATEATPDQTTQTTFQEAWQALGSETVSQQVKQTPSPAAVYQKAQQSPTPAATPHQDYQTQIPKLAKFCNSCGTPFLEDEKFCKGCGKPRPIAPSVTPAGVISNSAAQTPEQSFEQAKTPTATIFGTFNPDSSRAVLAGAMLAICCLVSAVIFRFEPRVIILVIEKLFAYALLGTAVYLICQRDRKPRIMAGVFVAIAALFSADSAMPIRYLLSITYLGYIRLVLLSLVMLITFAIALGVAFAINKQRKSDPLPRRFIMSSGVATAVLFLIDLAVKFIRLSSFDFYYMTEMPSDTLLYSAFILLVNAAVTFLVALLTYKLCSKTH